MTQSITLADVAVSAADIDNPYWDAVRPHLQPAEDQWRAGVQIGKWENYGTSRVLRDDLVKRYSWTVTDPHTVAFVALWAGPKLIDPMAGTGYWAYLLRQMGVLALASDANPPDISPNHWHRDAETHCRVRVASGTVAVACNGIGRTLLLSWPPYNTGDGADILAAYPGDRVIYIGEGDGGCTGNDRMHEMFYADWVEVASYAPVQYLGIRDYVIVYDRKRAELAVAS